MITVSLDSQKYNVEVHRAKYCALVVDFDECASNTRAVSQCFVGVVVRYGVGWSVVVPICIRTMPIGPWLIQKLTTRT